jgi:hypothetical protein
MTQDELVWVLRDMAERVEQGDSFEGSITYEIPLEADGDRYKEVGPEGTYALVRASYRIGNTMGQGGVRLIGEHDD